MLAAIPSTVECSSAGAVKQCISAQSPLTSQNPAAALCDTTENPLSRIPIPLRNASLFDLSVSLSSAAHFRRPSVTTCCLLSLPYRCHSAVSRHGTIGRQEERSRNKQARFASRGVINRTGRQAPRASFDMAKRDGPLCATRWQEPVVRCRNETVKRFAAQL